MMILEAETRIGFFEQLRVIAAPEDISLWEAQVVACCACSVSFTSKFLI